MDHEDEKVKNCGSDAQKSWSLETRDMFDSLMVRFSFKERQLTDRENQLDAERIRLQDLRNEV